MKTMLARFAIASAVLFSVAAGCGSPPPEIGAEEQGLYKSEDDTFGGPCKRPKSDFSGNDCRPAGYWGGMDCSKPGGPNYSCNIHWDECYNDNCM